MVDTLHAPGKGADVSDWLNAGGTVEELARLVEQTPDWELFPTEHPEDGRVLLGEIMENGVEPPEELVDDVLLAGKVHSIYSGPGKGKTFLMLWLILRVIEQGLRVLLFDQENGSRILAERFEQLGADPKKLDEYLHYYFCPDDLSITKGALSRYEARLDEVQPALVLFDSWIDFLAANGLDENSSNDIATWAAHYTRPARRRGIAVLLLDHVPKEGGSSRGSGRKKDEVDVMWALSNPDPFDRDKLGQIVLEREKDREGWLPKCVGFSVGGGADGFVFERSTDRVEGADQDGLKESERKTLSALEGFGERGATATEWQRAAEDAPKGEEVPRRTFYRAKPILLAKGYVLQVEDRFCVAGATDAKEVPHHTTAPGPEEGATGATTLRVAPGGTGATPEEDEVEELKRLLAETAT